MDDKQIKTVIYGAEWCPPCHAVKAYLKSRNVDYEYVNIDEQREKGMEISQKTGWSAIPIINIGEEYILGFDRPKIDAALQAHKLI
ncbi:MAG TPA: glutaredoxin family protein [Candidatus Saccharimonadales bacterium]|nr:glutaredoxin family protein [Candidatus Saccharimonadales bacterium]